MEREENLPTLKKIQPDLSNISTLKAERLAVSVRVNNK